MPPWLTATFLPTRSLTDAMPEPFLTRMPSPAASGATAVKNLKPGRWASEVIPEVMEPVAMSSWSAFIAWAAGAKGPALPVQRTVAPTFASALSRLPSFLPRARTPELPGSGIRMSTVPLAPWPPPSASEEPQAVTARSAVAVRSAGTTALRSARDGFMVSETSQLGVMGRGGRGGRRPARWRGAAARGRPRP